jgi:hypothetical protein
MFGAEGMLRPDPHVGLVPQRPLHKPDSRVGDEVDDIITIGIPGIRHERADGAVAPDVPLLIKHPDGRRDDPTARVSIAPVPAHLNLKANTPEDEAIHPRMMTVLFPTFSVMAHLAGDDADDTFMRDVVQNLAPLEIP